MKIWKIRSKITGKFLIDSYGKFNKIGKTWNNKDGAVRFRENTWFDTRVGGPHRREDTEVVEYNMIEVSQRRTDRTNGKDRTQVRRHEHARNNHASVVKRLW